MKKERTQKKFEEEGIEKKNTEFFLERKASGVEIFLGERQFCFQRLEDQQWGYLMRVRFASLFAEVSMASFLREPLDRRISAIESLKQAETSHVEATE